MRVRVVVLVVECYFTGTKTVCNHFNNIVHVLFITFISFHFLCPFFFSNLVGRNSLLS